ncbi:cellulose binding domain-containing protein [Paractinoplanes rhizophilus]|uniref:Cellulose binding domain-containing protein n=1 Tax=Paractinoplanes rhizophilus TaxID=1416877 RepID=A0ABW2HN27_9ACTN|nr:cellulose binding domain-containing protein [Actinoplanes sp.]
MLRRLGVVLGGTVLAVAGLVAAGVGGATAAPAPAPTLTCPPALPVSGVVTASTTTSLTISYTMLLTPPCGYDPPVTVSLFTALADAQQWLNPVAEVVSGPERNGTVTIGGLTPDTAYWFRFSADGQHDPYMIGSGRTAPLAACAATMVVDSAWGDGFVATVTVRNVGSETLGGWRVSWRWAGVERILSLWNAVTLDSTDGVAVGNASYNGTLPVGASTTFGMMVAGAPSGQLTLTCGR